MPKFVPFDAADYLDDEETIAEYLTAALEDSNPDGSSPSQQTQFGFRYLFLLKKQTMPRKRSLPTQPA